ncbi:MAG: class I SAM-dependent methyltransferase [SAR202 cluster bacterium]|nr:class I SAM-dependent methyltransferase [SAR202 cluster bacterium]
MIQPTKRFSNRVADYIRYRPSYPPEVIETLRRQCDLGVGSAVADIGSGTGIFTALLLNTGARVYGVEPNDEMRLAGESALSGHAGFRSVCGTAEATELPGASVDLITVAQAFHWFRPEETRREFRRILRPSGWTALIWNTRDDSLPFHRHYDALLRRYSPEYADSNHTDTVGNPGVRSFFGEGFAGTHTFKNGQLLDLASLKGRTNSSSYCPTPDSPNHAPLMAGLDTLFAKHAVGGKVSFGYITEVHLGRV